MNCNLIPERGIAGLLSPDDQSRVPDLAVLLWEALVRVEASEGYTTDNPVFNEFRGNILRIIGDLEILRSRGDEEPAPAAAIPSSAVSAPPLGGDPLNPAQPNATEQRSGETAELGKTPQAGNLPTTS